MNGPIVGKSSFAQMCGVSGARVSQWISSGKIYGEALIGSGQTGKIVASVAKAQLRETLDANGRMGLNGLSTRLEDDPPVVKPRGPVDYLPPSIPVPRASDPVKARAETVESQIKAEKLRHAQLQTSRLEEEDRARRGIYVEARAVRAEMTRMASDLLTDFEGALPDFASALAGKLQVSPRDTLHILRTEFRKVRERMAASHAAAAAAEPKMIEAREDEPSGIQ